MPYTPPICVSVAAFWHVEERRWHTTAYIEDPTRSSQPRLASDCEFGPFDTWTDVRSHLGLVLDTLAEEAQTLR